MVAFYKHDIPAWMDGTEGLDHEEYRAYHVICQLIYLSEHPITNHEVGIAGRCNMHPLKFRTVLRRLIDKKKVAFVGGKITNTRAEVEVGKIEVRRRSRRGEAGVDMGSGVGRGEGQPSKPLENKASPTTTGATRLDETRQEKTKDADAPSVDDFFAEPTQPSQPQKAPDAKVYARGREVLGVPPKKAGWLVKSLIASQAGNLNLAMSVLERAATKDKPADYVAAAIHRVTNTARELAEGSGVYSNSIT